MSCFESFNVTVSAVTYPFVPKFRLAYYWAACGSQFKYVLHCLCSKMNKWRTYHVSRAPYDGAPPFKINEEMVGHFKTKSCKLT